MRISQEAASYHNLIGTYPTGVEVQRFQRRFK
jgi:hypothetical protein